MRQPIRGEQQDPGPVVLGSPFEFGPVTKIQHEGFGPGHDVILHRPPGDLGEAEDVTQEAYGRAWGRWAQVSRMGDPQAWVRTVAWRLAANGLRHRRRAALRLLLRVPVPPATEPSVDNVAIVDALRRLPAEQRRAIVLYYLADLTLEQAAAETGASISAVKSRLARGRAALATLLDDDTSKERNV